MTEYSQKVIIIIDNLFKENHPLPIMDKNSLEEIAVEQRLYFDHLKEGLIDRDILYEIKDRISSPFIILISGIRRCGKSTLLRLIRERYYKEKTIHYFSFEDERLFDFNVKDFNYLLETLLKINGNSNIFFFDEIQYIEGWEMFVRRLHDSGSKIFITGSNLTMISRELGTRLTGRYVRMELYPFSFKEYLRYKEIHSDPIEVTERRARIRAAFDEYIEVGGFPEYIQTGDKRFLRDLFDSIIYRDIISRRNIGDERPLKEFIRYIFSNYSNDLNLSRLKRDLGLGSVNTLKSYFQFLMDSYLVFQTSRYDPSIRKQMHTMKRAYVIDQGLIDTVSFRSSKDIGRSLENIVLVELKRRGKDVYYFRNGYECDFLIRDGFNVTSAIQVSTHLKENEEREVKGLMKAVGSNKLKHGLILTLNQEEVREIDGIRIDILPIWKWLLIES